ncbi:tyrosine-protein phosphatase [Microbacteriaceae bacterium 4G12]
MTEIKIDGVLNARSFGDVSVWLVRSGSLDGLTPAGRARLAELGVSLVLDLRDPTERRGPAPRENQDDRHAPIGFEVLHVPLYATASGPPVTGDIEDVYSTLVRERGSAIATAVGAIADSDGAVLVHCAVGKDRTGLVVALALLLGGMPREEILADYALSGAAVDAARRPYVEALLRDSGVTGAALESALRLHLESPAEAMRHALNLIDELGGPHAYLLRHGMSPEQFARIRDRAAAASGADAEEDAA